MLLTLLGVLLGGIVSYIVNLIFAARNLPSGLDLQGDWVGLYQSPRHNFEWVPEVVHFRKRRQSYFFSSTENPDGDPVQGRVLAGNHQYVTGEWWSGRHGSPARGGFILTIERHGNVMYGVATHSVDAGYSHGGWVLARKESPALDADLDRGRQLLAKLNGPLIGDFRQLSRRPSKESSIKSPHESKKH